MRSRTLTTFYIMFFMLNDNTSSPYCSYVDYFTVLDLSVEISGFSTSITFCHVLGFKKCAISIIPVNWSLVLERNLQMFSSDCCRLARPHNFPQITQCPRLKAVWRLCARRSQSRAKVTVQFTKDQVHILEVREAISQEGMPAREFFIMTTTLLSMEK